MIYRTARAARTALLDTRIRAALRGRPERERSAYRCPICRYWHLTKQA